MLRPLRTKPPLIRGDIGFRRCLAAVLLAAAVLFVLLWVLLPSRALGLPSPPPGPPALAGAFHVHSQRSDGSGTPDEIAAAAARAGLQFLIFTDHGDATRAPDPPQYRAGVLCIDAVEISTASGHYIALGLPPVPYPLGGEPRDVVEDVSRLGGFGVAAHPESPKRALRWDECDAPFDALEWLNADSEWRDERAGTLAGAFMVYPLRPAETIGSLLDRPDLALQRWDMLTQQRRVVSLPGSDAHGRVGLRSEDADASINTWFLRLPSYEASFRAFTTRVTLDQKFSGHAERDAGALIHALRAGHLYAAIDALASPPFLLFSAKRGQSAAQQGEVLQSGGPLELSVRTNAPSGSTIKLMRNGTLVHSSVAAELRFQASSEPGVFRVEVTLASAPGRPAIPWLLSNPIWAQPAGWPTASALPRRPAAESLEIGAGGWRVEQDARSTGRIISNQDNSNTDKSSLSRQPPQSKPSGASREGTGAGGGAPAQIKDDGEWLMTFQYGLADGAVAGQYSALALSTGSALIGRDRLSFRARARQPMRVVVQARRQIVGERWQRSIYLDTQPRDVTIFFDDMRPVGVTSSLRLDPAQIDTVLFVVDTTNTRPGSQGTFSLSSIKLQR